MPVIRSFGGCSPNIDPSAFIAETAVLIGDVSIGPGASIWYGCVLRGDVSPIVVGEGTNIQDGTIVHVNHDRDGSGGMATVIGSGVTIGHQSLLHACHLEDGCFVGMGAVVMDGATLERGSMLAAGALLTPRKRVPRGALWGGRPAKFFRALSEEEQSDLVYSAEHYRRLSQRYLSEIKTTPEPFES